MQMKTEETVDDGRSDIAVYDESLCCSDCEKDWPFKRAGKAFLSYDISTLFKLIYFTQ